MLRHLQEKQTFVLKSANDLDLLPSVHVGGNGCKLFHWVAKGAYSDDASINEIFRSMLLEGAGWKSPRGRLKIRISDQPKAEAACGLVVKYGLGDFDSFDEAAFDSLVAGEKFTADGTSYEATSLISRELIQKKPAVQSLESLYKFADVYNAFAQKPGWTHIEPIRNVKQMAVTVHKVMDQWANQQATLNARDVELEPVFIVALKAFLAEFLAEGEKDA
jgi:hypothetical protein